MRRLADSWRWSGESSSLQEVYMQQPLPRYPPARHWLSNQCHIHTLFGIVCLFHCCCKTDLFQLSCRSFYVERLIDIPAIGWIYNYSIFRRCYRNSTAFPRHPHTSCSDREQHNGRVKPTDLNEGQCIRGSGEYCIWLARMTPTTVSDFFSKC